MARQRTPRAQAVLQAERQPGSKRMHLLVQHLDLSSESLLGREPARESHSMAKFGDASVGRSYRDLEVLKCSLTEAYAVTPCRFCNAKRSLLPVSIRTKHPPKDAFVRAVRAQARARTCRATLWAA